MFGFGSNKNDNFLSKREICNGDNGQGIMKKLNKMDFYYRNCLSWIFVWLYERFVMLLKLTVENLNLF